jgi:hypothetical protein
VVSKLKSIAISRLKDQTGLKEQEPAHEAADTSKKRSFAQFEDEQRGESTRVESGEADGVRAADAQEELTLIEGGGRQTKKKKSGKKKL